mgnify:CR=1 FL=1
MKYQLDKDNPIPAVDIFNTSKTGMIKPDDDRFANGWAYQDKAFYEYFNFFWNETSTSLNQVNPFLKSLDEEITEIKTQLTQASGGSIQFDTTQNNWFANSFMWLKGLIDKEVTDRTNAIKTASDSLSETINAKDSNLKSLISTETSERKSADTALGTKIDNEVTARTNADKTINDSLANKADKATTLAGYGITDGASKTDISNASVEDRKWANITGKPSTFPPSSHTHTISQITDLQNQLNGLKNDINIVAQSNSHDETVNLTFSKIGNLNTITLPSVDFNSGYTYSFYLKVTISEFYYKDVTPRTVNILVPQNGRKYSKIAGQTMYSFSSQSDESSSVKMAITPSANEGVYTPSDGIVGKITITNRSPGSVYWGYSFSENLKIAECRIIITPLF